MCRLNDVAQFSSFFGMWSLFLCLSVCKLSQFLRVFVYYYKLENYCMDSTLEVLRLNPFEGSFINKIVPSYCRLTFQLFNLESYMESWLVVLRVANLIFSKMQRFGCLPCLHHLLVTCYIASFSHCLDVLWTTWFQCPVATKSHFVLLTGFHLLNIVPLQ